jgi:hypothetical protein
MTFQTHPSRWIFHTNQALALIFLLFCENGYAQIRMGVIAGPDIVTNTLNNVEIGVINPAAPCFCGVKHLGTRPVILYSAGFTAEYLLSSAFSISTKTLFAAKGWNENIHYADFNPGTSAVTYDSKDKYRFNYFEVPLYFVFNSSLGNRGAVFHVGLGGFAAFALAGKYEFHLLGSQNITAGSGTLTDHAIEDGLPVLTDSSNLIAVNNLQRKLTNFSANGLNLGASGFLGIEMDNGFHYDLSFSAGFRNILTGGFYPYPRVNRLIGLGISAGYYFNKFKIDH